MATNQLGSFQFIRMSPPPLVVQDRIARTAQAGTDGTSYWQMGKAGRPFQVTTVVEALNVAAAFALYQAYYSLLAAEPQTLQWAGQTISGQKFKVLSVEPNGPNSIRQIGFGFGGVNGGVSFGMVECVWTLEAVANPPT